MALCAHSNAACDKVGYILPVWISRPSNEPIGSARHFSLKGQVCSARSFSNRLCRRKRFGCMTLNCTVVIFVLCSFDAGGALLYVSSRVALRANSEFVRIQQHPHPGLTTPQLAQFGTLKDSFFHIEISDIHLNAIPQFSGRVLREIYFCPIVCGLKEKCVGNYSITIGAGLMGL